MSDENIRITNEVTRKSNETIRINNEDIRKSNESIRVDTENIRNNNETIRQSNESSRISAEQERVNAENARQADYTEKINDFVAEIERVEAIYPERLTKVEDDLASHKEEYVQHQNSTMPHKIQDIDNDKTYKFGLRIKNGITQFIYEEEVL